MEKIKASALVIDDQADILSICSKVLSGVFTEVVTASSCSAARAIFRSLTFDLVLTDINIDKDGDGIALAQEIKTVSPATSVVIMTAEPTLDTAIQGLKTGVIEYIVKPFSPEYLESVIRNSVEKSRLFSELEREKVLKLDLESAYSQLKNSERLKDAFLSRVNHELRTPLAIAMASVRLVCGELKEGASGELCARSEKALQKLQFVIEELLLFTDLLKGQIKIKKAPVDLLPILDEASRGLAFLYEEMQIRVAFSSEGEPYPVPVDAGMIAALLKQLFSNAVKFNTRGGSVLVKTVYLPDRVILSFKNTGSVVSDEVIPHIFDGFFQAAEHLTRTVGGLGLGLATVKLIVEGHGGSVAAQKNTDGPGMTFTVALPRR